MNYENRKTKNLLSAAILALTSFAAAGAGEPAEMLSEMSTSVEEIRGLHFKRPVGVEVIDDAVAAEHITRRLLKFRTRSDMNGWARAMSLLGLLPPETDPMEVYVEVMEEQAGGFYDPDSGNFYMLDDMPTSVGPAIMAHELTHALDDQHYGLDAQLELAGETNDNDRVFAWMTVVEGSAVLVMTGYLTDQMIADMEETDAASGETIGRMPSLMRRQMLGSYILGPVFLSHGGVDRAVDVALEHPPTTSEQILHPEKYWNPEQRDEPVDVTLGSTGKYLGKGWTMAGHGQIGELGLGTLFDDGKELLSPGDWVEPETSGWDGDRWELWRSGETEVVILKTIWDTPEDAAEFARNYPQADSRVAGVQGRMTVVVSGDIKRRKAERLMHRELDRGI